MFRIRECTDTEECRHIWKQVWPDENIFDLWEVRNCFNRTFDRPAHFLIAEDGQRIEGVLPLSWIDEEQQFALFPGETWKGKTWLEQNKIPAASPRVQKELLASIPGPAHLRYLSPECIVPGITPAEHDETGYLFSPGNYSHSFPSYVSHLSKKFRKNYEREVSRLNAEGVSYRYNNFGDIDYLFHMNIQNFGEGSYFFDPRFLGAFEYLVSFLLNTGMIRITTVMVRGEIAAVDLGAVWKNYYTVLAGGSNPEFMGIAKVINLHHLEWACSERLESVDFLCGDFGWKERFRLTPRPLYSITADSAACTDKTRVYAYAGDGCA